VAAQRRDRGVFIAAGLFGWTLCLEQTLVGPNNSAFVRRNGSQWIGGSSMFSSVEQPFCDPLQSGANHGDALTGSDNAEVAGSSPASPTKKLMSAYSLARSPTTVTRDQGTKGRRRRTADQVRPAFVVCHRIPGGP
jgi:hypothetical protein